MSSYFLQGSIRAMVCDTCWDAVGGAEILLYLHRDDQKSEKLVAERVKHSFMLLSNKAVDAKKSSLIARAKTNADGSFQVKIDDDRYDGGPFEIDMRLVTVPGTDPDKPQAPVQVTLASLAPKWHREKDIMVTSAWHHMISARYWCHILAKYDIWVICGRVVATGSQT
ncbi:MAG: hypothetical protein GQ565_04715, partial [Candidatus Aegiribacteria sp.]|nr:hypothetical protein [Candidatus Aegiribacteria sp.]